METIIDGEMKRGVLHDVLYAPKMKRNLFSIGKAMRQGLKANFDDEGAIFRDRNGEAVIYAKQRSNLYVLEGSVIRKTANVAIPFATQESQASMTLWHRHLGHVGTDNLNYMALNNIVRGLPNSATYQTQPIPLCESCTINKLTRAPFKTMSSHTWSKLHIVHTDICGPMKTASHQGSRYFITFIDDYSRRVWVYFIKEKSEAFAKFRDFKASVENYTGLKIKTLRSDRGGEYMSGAFTAFLQENGIRHQTTAPYSPQQNGVAERFNRTVVEMARTMLHDANLPDTYWAEAINTATYIRNRCISRALGNKVTPEELWRNQKPNVQHMKAFGCIAYAYDERYKTKFAKRAQKCIFLGYAPSSKAYRLFNLENKKIIISRNIKFDETKNIKSQENIITQRIIPRIGDTNAAPNNTNVAPNMQIEEIIDETNNVDHDNDERQETSQGQRQDRSLQSNLGSYWQPAHTSR